jgi:hypothetical protein
MQKTGAKEFGNCNGFLTASDLGVGKMQTAVFAWLLA